MVLTSFITIPTLIKLWLLSLILYSVRKTASSSALSIRNEIFLYLTVATIAYIFNTVLNYVLFGGGMGLSSNGKTEMDREESDLVREYLRHRRKDETLGGFLARMEREEAEEESRLMAAPPTTRTRRANGDGGGKRHKGRK